MLMRGTHSWDASTQGDRGAGEREWERRREREEARDRKKCMKEERRED